MDTRHCKLQCSHGRMQERLAVGDGAWVAAGYDQPVTDT